jgi:acetoin utilization deacetylase AcuC-like enzyme
MTQSARVALYSDSLFERHETGAHPECPDRVRSIRAHLQATGLDQRCRPETIRAATSEELQRIHPAGYVQAIQRTAQHGGGRLDPDTVVSPASYEVAVAAAGTACAAVDLVMQGDVRRALCLVRPPGHHALEQRAMGFCLFNNAAVATAHAREVHGVDRVLIVDWDVHHGNGTQDIFYFDGQVNFLSAHRYPFYPGTGAADETGSGPGLGATVNLPLRFGISRRNYIGVFTRAVEELADRCRPQLVLISAGFDPHALDPIGSLGLECEDFSELTRIVLNVARQHAGGRVISLLEGGYNLDALAESVGCHLTTLLEDPA